MGGDIMGGSEGGHLDQLSPSQGCFGEEGVIWGVIKWVGARGVTSTNCPHRKGVLAKTPRPLSALIDRERERRVMREEGE